MGRKGNQQKNGVDQQRSQSLKKGVSDASTTEDKANTNDELDHIQDGKNSKKKNKKSQKKEKKVIDETVKSHAVPCTDNTEADTTNISTAAASNIGDRTDERVKSHIPNLDNMNSFEDLSDNGHNREEGLEFPETAIFKFLRTAAISVARSSAEWVERHKPTFVNLRSNTLKARDHVRTKIQQAQPIILRWIMHIGNIMLLLFMVWLECTLRGIDSFLRMGTTSFFSIIWCSVLSVIAMVGITKFLITVAVAASVGLFLGFTLAVLLTGIIGIIFLWFYGSFWTTGFIIFLGGLAFLTSHDRIALFITSAYSVYCAWKYVGWFGLVLGLNLSFISSDALLFFLRNVIHEQRTPPNASQEQAASFFPNEGSPNDGGPAGPRADRGPGVPSTSGSDSETTSEDEVVRLLNCTDHYAALGLARFENIDVSIVKREYRKKAMLVHPDKNMGNEKAAEAFKKLQNAYEVLLDSFKRKEYDDELRREELLNYFRKFQNASPENTRGHGLFRSGFAHPEADGEDPLLAESRRIACKKCGFFHLWAFTKKSKSRARWCQECKDFHQAKDGDGWVEQSSRPFLFGLLQQVEAPSAYVCADGKVYNVTQWYICQGMRCPVNTHKPSFHVNTSMVSKNAPTKGSNSGQRSSGGIPTPMEETMTEDEFYEWLQNAVQNGMFENFPGNTSESPPKGSANNGSGSSSSSAGGKRRKKGKKQW